MKINLNIEELKYGATIRRLGKQQLEKIPEAIANKRPILLSKPAILDNRWIAVIQPHSVTPMSDGKYEFKFKPAWCRVMVVCHMRSTKVKSVVAEFDHGQYEFTEGGERPSSYTLSGPGVDPEMVQEAQIARSGWQPGCGGNVSRGKRFSRNKSCATLAPCAVSSSSWP